MTRSFTTNLDVKHIAHGYKVFNDGRLSEDDLPLLKGGDAFEGSGSLTSCVNDMIIWCKVLIQAMRAEPSINDKFEEACPPSVATESFHGVAKQSVLNAIRTATQSQFSLAKDSQQANGLGLFSSYVLTSEINTLTSGHAPEIMNSYTIGAGSPPMLAVGHTGDLGSFTNAYWTFPRTESAVIVMTYASSTYGDPSNILAQVLIQALFDIQLAIVTMRSWLLGWWPRLMPDGRQFMTHGSRRGKYGHKHGN